MFRRNLLSHLKALQNYHPVRPGNSLDSSFFISKLTGSKSFVCTVRAGRFIKIFSDVIISFSLLQRRISTMMGAVLLKCEIRVIGVSLIYPERIHKETEIF